MEISYNVLKALHIIFVVTWFAGLFYIVRLFIYHREAADKSEPDRSILISQFIVMEKRLMYAITWPSAILATLFGSWLLLRNPALLTQGYMQVKLIFVSFLWCYQLYGQVILSQLHQKKFKYSSTTLRLYNEVPTVILIAVVFLIILRNSIDWVYGVIGILGTAVALTLAIKIYKQIRQNNP